MPSHQAHEQNRLSWNAATERHNLHKGDQAAFFREGGNTLHPEESGLLGDLRGQTLAHLQCNCGQDTLSIARHHGATVTGIDISDVAIEFARKLSTESGIPGSFERADIVEWCQRPEAPSFDVAFTSYGALTWLSDLGAWARGIANILKPGGRLVLVEYHPAILTFAEGTAWHLKYDYLGGSLVEDAEGVGDYVGEASSLNPAELPPFANPHPAKAYCWGLAESVMPLIDAGLNITHLAEYPYSNGWRAHESLIEAAGRRFTMPPEMPSLAMMFSVVAHRPGDGQRNISIL